MDDTPETSESSEPSPPVSTPGRRRRTVVIAAGMVAVLAVAGIAFALLNDSGDGAESTDSSPVGTAQDARTTTTLTRAQAAAAAAKKAREEARRKALEERRKQSTTTHRSGANAGPTNPGPTSPPTTAKRPATPVPPPTVAPTILQAYIAGYTETCTGIWKIANSDGYLWDVAAGGGGDDLGTAYVLSDCQDQMDDTMAWDYDTPEDARQGAIDDAVWNLDFQMTGTVLRNTSGTKTWSSY